MVNKMELWNTKSHNIEYKIIEHNNYQIKHIQQARSGYMFHGSELFSNSQDGQSGVVVNFAGKISWYFFCSHVEDCSGQQKSNFISDFWVLPYLDIFSEWLNQLKNIEIWMT